MISEHHNNKRRKMGSFGCRKAMLRRQKLFRLDTEDHTVGKVFVLVTQLVGKARASRSQLNQKERAEKTPCLSSSI